MRSISELIDEVRFNTNQDKNIDRFPDIRLLSMFNRAQTHIELIAYSANPELSLKEKSREYAVSSDGGKLPSDMLGNDSIIHVKYNETGRLDRINIVESNLTKGYYLSKGKIQFAGVSDGTATLYYTAKIGRLEQTTDVPGLPDICETFLMEYVERKINAINSSSDVNSSNIFTKEEESMIMDIFKDNSRDIKRPVTLDTGYEW